MISLLFVYFHQLIQTCLQNSSNHGTCSNNLLLFNFGCEDVLKCWIYWTLPRKSWSNWTGFRVWTFKSVKFTAKTSLKIMFSLIFQLTEDRFYCKFRHNPWFVCISHIQRRISWNCGPGMDRNNLLSWFIQRIQSRN